MDAEETQESVQQRFERELNARAAFEAMLTATLTVAIAAMPIQFVIGVIAALFDGAALTRLPAIAIGALSLGFAIFLGGFVAALAIGVPLFMALERMKLRRRIHYVLGGVLANAIVYLVLAGEPPSLRSPVEFLYLLPGAAIALLFVRKVGPLWRMAQAAPPASGGGTVVRLH